MISIFAIRLMNKNVILTNTEDCLDWNEKILVHVLHNQHYLTLAEFLQSSTLLTKAVIPFQDYTIKLCHIKFDNSFFGSVFTFTILWVGGYH